MQCFTQLKIAKYQTHTKSFSTIEIYNLEKNEGNFSITKTISNSVTDIRRAEDAVSL